MSTKEQGLSRQQAISIIGTSPAATHWLCIEVRKQLKQEDGIAWPNSIQEIFDNPAYYPLVQAVLIFLVDEGKNHHAETNKKDFADANEEFSPEDFTPEFMTTVARALYS